jgi:capsule polysaccharide export protein KpsE/RkpR
MQQYHDAYQKYYHEWQQQYEIWYRAQWQQWQEAQPEEPTAQESVPEQVDMSNLPPEAQAIQQEVLQEMQGMSAWGASLDDRKAKFKKLILQYHPDKAAQSADLDPEVAKLIFQFVNAQKAWFLA